ncbi:MAG: hypothetical protein JWN12_270 [Candidatus Saccharibacteria bacterium]|nr:hypothetical protein [Candidatus Saccharibacteria bacterium]
MSKVLIFTKVPYNSLAKLSLHRVRREREKDLASRTQLEPSQSPS